MEVKNFFRLGPAIAAARRERGVPQKLIAFRSGVNETRLSAIERQRICGPSQVLVTALGRALSLDESERVELARLGSHDRCMKAVTREFHCPDQLALVASTFDAARVLSKEDQNNLTRLILNLVQSRQHLARAPRLKEVMMK